MKPHDPCRCRPVARQCEVSLLSRLYNSKGLDFVRLVKCPALNFNSSSCPSVHTFSKKSPETARSPAFSSRQQRCSVMALSWKPQLPDSLSLSRYVHTSFRYERGIKSIISNRITAMLETLFDVRKYSYPPYSA